jgi:hypothetical protein
MGANPLSNLNSKKSKEMIDRVLKENRFKFAKSHNKKGYSYHALPDKVYTKGKHYLFGNSAKIYGCVQDDYNSCDTI